MSKKQLTNAQKESFKKKILNYELKKQDLLDKLFEDDESFAQEVLDIINESDFGR